MMNADNKDWNYDRILSANAQMQDVQRDILVILQRGVMSANMKNRMVQMLRNAADEINATKTK